VELVVEDPFAALQRNEALRRNREDEAEGDRRERERERAVARARADAEAAGEQLEGPKATALGDREEGDGVRVELAAARGRGAGEGGGGWGAAAAFGEDDDDDGTGPGPCPGPGPGSKRSAAAALMQEEERARARRRGPDATEGIATAATGASDPPPSGEPPAPASWLLPSILVRIVSEPLRAHGYFGEKASVLRPSCGPDGNAPPSARSRVGEVEVLSSGDVLRVDDRELETVVPPPGKPVVVVLGRHRGRHGDVAETDKAGRRVRIVLKGGGDEKSVWLAYNAVSKWDKGSSIAGRD